jgi:hypothetical protein
MNIKKSNRLQYHTGPKISESVAERVKNMLSRTTIAKYTMAQQSTKTLPYIRTRPDEIDIEAGTRVSP